MSGRKTNTLCQQRLTNCHDGGRSVRGSAQFGITFSVLMSAMKVMNSDAPSSTPMIGRKESERNSKNESSQANLPRGPFARAAALMAAASSPPPPPAETPGSALMSL